MPFLMKRRFENIHAGKCRFLPAKKERTVALCDFVVNKLADAPFHSLIGNNSLFTGEIVMPKIHRNGFDLYFDDQGEGTPILLGHSFLCSGEMWRHQASVLSRRARAINMDYRGHGRSDHAPAPFTIEDLADDGIAILDGLNIDKAIWAGLSIGGMVSMEAAVRHPDRVMGLMLFNTHAGVDPFVNRINLRAMGWGSTLLGLRPFSSAIARSMFSPATCAGNKALVKKWKAVFAGNHGPSARFGLNALLNRRAVIQDLPGVTVPALVVTGDEDRGVAPRFSRDIAAALPDSELLEIPQAGHLTALEAPEAVTAAMLTWLERHRFIESR